MSSSLASRILTRHGRSIVATLALVGAVAAPRAAAAFDRLNYNGSSVLSPEIVPLFWGSWTAAEQTDNINYLRGLAGYLSGVGAPAGKEPVTRQYGVLGARVVNGASIGVGSDTLVKNTGVYQRIHLLQSQGLLPPNSASRVFVVFLKGFSYNFDDDSHVSVNTCAYHDSNTATYYAVMPKEVMDRLGCAMQPTLSHEIMEAATDPVVGNSWVTNTGTFTTAEGGDQCEITPTPLSFGQVQPFTDDSVMACTSFTNSTTTHLAATTDGTDVLDVYWPTAAAGAVTHGIWNGLWWASESLVDPAAQNGGTVFVGAPSVVRTTSTRTDLFVMGSDNFIHHAFKDRAVSNSWTWMSSIGAFIGQPSAVSWSSGRIDMVALGTDSSVMHLFSGDSGNTFFVESMGGQTKGQPRIISRGAGLLDFFTLGMPGDIVEDSWNGSAWSGYHVIVGNSNGMSLPPAITSWDVNRKDVFSATVGGLALHTAWRTGYNWNGSWAGWQYPYGSPEATPRSPFGMDIAWQGNERHAHYQGFNKTANAWTAAMDLGGIYNGPPTIAQGLDGRVYIVGAGTDGCLYYTTTSDRSAWTGPSWSGICGIL